MCDIITRWEVVSEYPPYQCALTNTFHIRSRNLCVSYVDINTGAYFCFVVERKLDPNEYPLEVQLNWTRDEKEGKFVLRNAAHKPINVNKVSSKLHSLLAFTTVTKYLYSSCAMGGVGTILCVEYFVDDFLLQFQADKNAESSFKRKLSKREKKDQKKKDKDKQSSTAADDSDKEDVRTTSL